MNLFIKTTSLHMCARCMTLSVLETSLPMQRSRDALSFWHFSPKLVSWGVTTQTVTHLRKNNWGPLRSKYDASTLECEPSGVTSPQATLSSQAISPFGHSAMRDTFALGHSGHRSHTPSQWNLHVVQVHGTINESLHQDNSTHVCKAHSIVCFGDQSANAEK